MKKIALIVSIVLLGTLTGCQQGGTPVSDLPVAAGETCVGHNKHTITDTRTYPVKPPINGDCYSASQCDQSKEAMIEKAEKSAATYCEKFTCADKEARCHGVFTLTAANCTINVITKEDGSQECHETVVISGTIDCTCDG